MKRIFAGIVLFASALFLTPWIALAFGFVLFFFFERYYEVLFIAIFVDALAGSTSRLTEWEWTFSTIAFLGYFAAWVVKRRMRFSGKV